MSALKGMLRLVHSRSECGNDLFYASFDDRFATSDLLLSLANMIICDGLEIVHVVKVHIFQKSYSRIDIPRDGNVDQ